METGGSKTQRSAREAINEGLGLLSRMRGFICSLWTATSLADYLEVIMKKTIQN